MALVRAACAIAFGAWRAAISIVAIVAIVVSPPSSSSPSLRSSSCLWTLSVVCSYRGWSAERARDHVRARRSISVMRAHWSGILRYESFLRERETERRAGGSAGGATAAADAAPEATADAAADAAGAAAAAAAATSADAANVAAGTSDDGDPAGGSSSSSSSGCGDSLPRLPQEAGAEKGAQVSQGASQGLSPGPPSCLDTPSLAPALLPSRQADSTMGEWQQAEGKRGVVYEYNTASGAVRMASSESALLLPRSLPPLAAPPAPATTAH